MVLPSSVHQILRVGLAVFLVTHSTMMLLWNRKAADSSSTDGELVTQTKAITSTAIEKDADSVAPSLPVVSQSLAPFQVHKDDKELDIYGAQSTTLPTDMPLVVEQYKLVLFPNYKAGSTAWKSMLRRMMGHTKRLTTFEMIHDFEQNGLKRLGDFSVERVQEIMTDPTWTRAMFVRDPMERWLSSYLHFGEARITKMCCRQEAPKSVCLDKHARRSQSKEEYFFEIMSRCRNGHWALQSDRLSPKYWQQINWVGHFETMQQDAEALLRKVGAWEEHGASGWGPQGNEPAFAKRPNDQDGSSGDILDGQSHATHASSKLGNYVTPSMYNKMLEHYRQDYENPLFRLKAPTLEHILAQKGQDASDKTKTLSEG